jgi:hypothetical protein
VRAGDTRRSLARSTALSLAGIVLLFWIVRVAVPAPALDLTTTDIFTYPAPSACGSTSATSANVTSQSRERPGRTRRRL